MKVTISLLCLLMIPFESLKAREVNLNSPEIALGKLKQVEGERAKEVLTLFRTHKTPKRVNLSFGFQSTEVVCTKSEKKCIDYPKRYVCHTMFGDARDCYYKKAYRVCEDICLSSKFVHSNKEDKFQLKFKNVAPLSPGEKEVYELEIKQKSLSSGSVKERFEIVEGKDDYSIRDWFFRNGATVKGDY